VTGANGARKSSFYRALRLLADVAQGRAIASLAAEGGFYAAIDDAFPESTVEIKSERGRFDLLMRKREFLPDWLCEMPRGFLFAVSDLSYAFPRRPKACKEHQGFGDIFGKPSIRDASAADLSCRIRFRKGCEGNDAAAGRSKPPPPMWRADIADIGDAGIVIRHIGRG
jgi:hypothetical protein